MRTRRLTACILAFCALLSLFACRNDNDASEEPQGQAAQAVRSVVTDENGTEWLVHIYKAKPFELPADWTVNEESGIQYDPKSDTFRGVLRRMEEVETEDGEIVWLFDTEIAVWNRAGELTIEVPLRDPDRSRIGCAYFHGMELICLRSAADGATFGVFDTSSGNLTRTVRFSDITGWDSEDGVRDLAVNSTGDIYAAGGSTVTVFTREFATVCTITARAFDMAVTPDGEVWAICTEKGGRSLSRLDPDSAQKVRLCDVESRSYHLAIAPSEEAEGGFAALVSGASGINRWTLSADGTWSEGECMNFSNSNVSYNTGLEGREDSEQMEDAAGKDALVFIAAEYDENGKLRYSFNLYEKAPDLDLSKIRTVTLAHDRELDDNVQYQITRFNREHDDIRVTTLDYSDYNTDSDRTGGSWRLANDMANGLVRPDAVYGAWTGDAVGRLMRKGQIADLGAFLDNDPSLSREDIAGCVLRSFDDGNGGLWGISPFFHLRTVVGLTSVLGKYAEGWDIDGFLDFAESLPEGTILSSYACRETRGEIEPDPGLFFGEDGPAYDSPSFVRYLTWMKALPTFSDLKKQSPAAGLDPAELKPYYADGSVALQYLEAYNADSLLSVFLTYGSEPIAFLGYPAKEGSGTIVETDDVFVIPADAPDPDAAWELIHSFLMADGLTDTRKWSESPGMSAYLPLLLEECEKVRSKTIAFFADGRSLKISSDYTEDEIPGLLEELYPGIPYTLVPGCTDEQFENALELIDRSGRPFRNELPDGLDDIVSEEISGFIAGLGTPEDCAAKIQSRAAIWWAENR